MGRKRGSSGLLGAVRRVGMAAENALEIARLGRLTAPIHAPYKIVHQTRVARLRRYGGDDYRPSIAAPVLLVPPLMVTSEIYDMSPDVSAVSALLAAGLDVWLIDFGIPEEEAGGLDRTLDDHIKAVSDSIDRVHDASGSDVHLLGYSQGGMFAYEAAAYRACRGVASIVTFGAPVDIHRNLPAISDTVASRIIDAVRYALETPLQKIEALPGVFTSTGFKVLSLRKEVGQLFEFVQKLHDRQALEQREGRRRFLGGEGFVAWPGPALRTFIDEFIVQNRLASGGFVIDGRTVTLADIRCPILFFVGERDSIAQPAAVRAIHRAAPNSELYEVSLKAGHFGLVVGSRALQQTWPTVISWIRWHEDLGPRPTLLTESLPPEEAEEAEEASFEAVDFDVELFYDAITKQVSDAWDQIGDATKNLGKRADSLRWQLPRLSVLRHMTPDTRISLGEALAEQATHNPDGTFFLWSGRAFSYRDADQRVNHVVRGLIQCGVRPGERVGVLMGPRPSYLSITAALSRLGAVAVLLSPSRDRQILRNAVQAVQPAHMVSDPENAALAQQLFKGQVLVLGGFGQARPLPAGLVDMEEIDPDVVELPNWYEANPGRARDLAMIMLTAGRGDKPRAARITNRRWAFSAYGTAAACTLSPKDTVYCALPLHHPAGMLVAIGGGLVGGARLALASDFEPELFWTEVRRYGASVVFYAGEMLRELLEAPPSASDNKNPVRLFAGSGLRADVWRRVIERYGPVGVLEFYASTEGTAVLANASGKKIGALGDPLPGSAEVALVKYDFEQQKLVTNEEGFCIPTDVDEPGLLLSKVDVRHPVASFDGHSRGVSESRLRKGVFATGDTWFITKDVLKLDAEGTYWFVSRASRMLRTPSGIVPSREIEDALYEFDQIRRVVVVGVSEDGHQVPMAVVVPREGFELEAFAAFIDEHLEPVQRPLYIKTVPAIPLTDGFRPRLIEVGVLPEAGTKTWRFDPRRAVYRPVEPDGEHVRVGE